VRSQSGALLKGILRCVPCGCAMTPVHTTKSRTKRYRYYVCSGAQKRGWNTCPSKSVPAGQIEAFVVEQIRAIAKDPALVKATCAATNDPNSSRVAERDREHRTLAEAEVQRALAVFDRRWDSLAPREQARLIALLIARVDYNGAAGKVSILFHPAGIKTLANERPHSRKESA
jgi:hypothetical protein